VKAFVALTQRFQNFAFGSAGWSALPVRSAAPISAVSAPHLAIAGGRSPPGKTLVAETLVAGRVCAASLSS
jgi:hypothetical protein